MKDIEIIIGSIFLFVFVLDLSILPYAVSRNYSIKNNYYSFHQRYGVIRTSILKVLFGITVIIGIIDPPLNAGKLYIVVICYSLYTLWSLILMFAAQPSSSSQKDLHDKKQLDSIVGFLVYPFEFLDSQKPFYDYVAINSKWSWSAFIIPEYWYFSHELLGAGYISWALLMLYFGLFFYFGAKAFICILLIRLISGAMGQKAYYAKHGKLA